MYTFSTGNKQITVKILKKYSGLFVKILKKYHIDYCITGMFDDQDNMGIQKTKSEQNLPTTTKQNVC